MVAKEFIKKYFESLAYFYSNLRYRIFVVFLLSLMIGILDGLGLSMFLPLLQMINDSGENSGENLGKLNFLVDMMAYVGIPFNLYSVLVFMALFFIAKGIVKYISSIYQVNILQWFIKKIRFKHIKGLGNLSYTYFIKSDVGRMQNTLTGEVTRVAQSYRNYFDAIQYMVLVLVYMTFAFYIDFQFALLVTIGGVISNFLFKTLYRNTKIASKRLTGENSRFQSLIIQEVGNYKYLKATGTLRAYGRKLKKSVEKIEITNKKIGKLDAIMGAAREPILVVIVIAVIYIQTYLLGSTLGPILISLVFFYRSLTYLMQMQIRYNKFLSVSGSLYNTQLFEKELKDNKEKNSGNTLNKTIQKLELKNGNFFYGENRVLHSIDLSIYEKETIAFVGESGSGKTTLINILSGLLPLASGNYYINGNKISEYEITSFQSKIGYITQDPVIFNDSVFNNVTFWDERSEINLKKFRSALAKAEILTYVEGLPDTYDEILGNNGVNLSGGQRQRISIARELYKDIEILILDEATSALDSETEKAIQQNIDTLKGNYIIFIVAHRIATIKNADRILVMQNGKIKNEGSFQNLISESDYFSRLVELQELSS